MTKQEFKNLEKGDHVFYYDEQSNESKLYVVQYVQYQEIGLIGKFGSTFCANYWDVDLKPRDTRKPEIKSVTIIFAGDSSVGIPSEIFEMSIPDVSHLDKTERDDLRSRIADLYAELDGSQSPEDVIFQNEKI